MYLINNLISIGAILPFLIMLAVALVNLNNRFSSTHIWRIFNTSAIVALFFTLSLCVLQATHQASLQSTILPGLITSPIQSWVSLLVQLLGTVIGIFSSRYLQGELRQQHYVACFSGVLASVHLLLLADHWLVLIFAWSAIGIVLERLLCFYQERPFATLAAHKKFIADRVADVLLIIAAGLAWWEVGSGSLTELSTHLKNSEISTLMQICALLLALGVIIRTALFPVHGWIIQVMEAPTPVSALLHAGVVNLAGFVLIRFAALLDVAAPARWLLIVFGLMTAVLAGLVMLTRISIKVKLAWSTVAQMGFMVLECGLGLYTLAAMHLLGHSLYKAHAFLSASKVVEESKLQQLRNSHKYTAISFMLAPLVAYICIASVHHFISNTQWPWWWSVVLAFAWAPMLWMSYQNIQAIVDRFVIGTGMLSVLTAIASFMHQLPFGTTDTNHLQAGLFATAGMALMYLLLTLIQVYPKQLSRFQRWSYAGFYVDEAYTRLALKLWPIDWVSAEKVSVR